MEKAMRAASACAAVQGLQACLAQGIAAASVPALIVELVCEWACSSGLPQLHESGQCLNPLVSTTGSLNII